MDNPFILLGGFIFFSFWWLDHSLKKWKREQEEKMDEILEAIDSLRSEEKFGTFD